MILLLLGVAPAATLSGYGAPELGGGFGGIGSPFVFGLAQTPTMARPPSAQVGLDIAAMYSRYAYTLDKQEEVVSEGTSAVPFLAGAAPIGRFGLGAAVFAPWARGGSSDPDGPQRFHSIEGAFTGIEGDLCAAWSPHDAWTIGAAGRVVNVTLDSHRAIDTGAMLNGMLGDEAGVPVGDPFLEGTQSLVGLSGWAPAWALGVRFAPRGGPTVDAAFRSAVDTTVEGTVQLHPSNDLEVYLEGDVAVNFVFPAEALLAVRVPAGPHSLGAEVGWIGWSSLSNVDSELSGLAVRSDDNALQSVLSSYGMSQADYVDGLGAQSSQTGMQDIVVGGLWGEFALGERVLLRPGAWYSPAALPDDYVHPGNADFASLDVRLAAAWRASEHWSLVGSVDYWVSGRRDIDESVFSLAAPASSGRVLPPGDGVYALDVARVGGGVLYHAAAW